MKSHVQKRPMNIQRDVFPWKQTYAWERDLWLVKETYSHEIRRTKKKKDVCISKRDVFPWKETYKQDVCLRERSIIVERDLFTWKTKYVVFKKMCAFFLLRDLFFLLKKMGAYPKRCIPMKRDVQKRSMYEILLIFITLQRDVFTWKYTYKKDLWLYKETRSHEMRCIIEMYEWKWYLGLLFIVINTIMTIKRDNTLQHI